ncbi:MAG: hypothetical protein FJ403_15900 [Verrucomicrobia bacterium]|nr:hypothetical protein [Verrucomicrobiota bacterium]
MKAKARQNPAEARATFNLDDSIKELESRIEEFKRTDQEFVLLEELLLVLHRQREYDRWLDTYLSVLYKHPTQSLVRSGAERALEVAKVADREFELV